MVFMSTSRRNCLNIIKIRKITAALRVLILSIVILILCAEMKLRYTLKSKIKKYQKLSFQEKVAQ